MYKNRLSRSHKLINLPKYCLVHKFFFRCTSLNLLDTNVHHHVTFHYRTFRHRNIASLSDMRTEIKLT